MTTTHNGIAWQHILDHVQRLNREQEREKSSRQVVQLEEVSIPSSVQSFMQAFLEETQRQIESQDQKEEQAQYGSSWGASLRRKAD